MFKKSNETTNLKKSGINNPIIRVIIALILGIALGVITNIYKLPNISIFAILGQCYISALKAIAALLVFFMVIDSITKMDGKNIKQSKGIMYVVVLYLVTSFIASFIAVISCFIWKLKIPGLTIDMAGESIKKDVDMLSGLILGIVDNPISAIINGNFLSILFWAIIFGVFLRVCKDTTKDLLTDVSTILSKTVQLIVKFAPIGVFGLIYSSIVQNGVDIFYDYGKLILLLVGVILFIAFVTNPLVFAIYTKKNPYPPLFKCLEASGINAFTMRSSAANIPINLNLCKEFKLDEKIYNITIPLGATINMDGAAVVITIMAMSAAWTLGIDIKWYQAVMMAVISTIAAAGSAGTAGGSLMLIPFACSLLGVPANCAWYTVGVGNQIGFIQDSFETAVNSSGDVYFNVAVEWAEKKK